MCYLYSNIPLQSITILLCLLIRNTCPFNTYYFAKYYYITFSSHIHVTLTELTTT